MKIIKAYESDFIPPWDQPIVLNFKILSSCLIKFCDSFGYESKNYSDKIEFISKNPKDDDYMFYIELIPRWSELKFTYNSKNPNKIPGNILNQLKSIDGLTLQNIDYDDCIVFNVGDDVDNIIDQLEMKMNTNKFNL